MSETPSTPETESIEIDLPVMEHRLLYLFAELHDMDLEDWIKKHLRAAYQAELDNCIAEPRKQFWQQVVNEALKEA